jgi:ribokinase
MKNMDVVVAGELFVDLILGGFDSWPEAGKESFAREFAREAGGGAAITACGLARLGTQTAVLGIVGGNDGDWLISRLGSLGVETSAIGRHASEPTGISVSVTTAGDRSFFTYTGANRGLPAALSEAARTRAFAGGRHVHLACAPPLNDAEELLASIHQNGCTVSLDAGWHEDWLAHPGLLPVLRSIDLFFPNEVEAARISGQQDTGRILDFFAGAGIRRVALKLGHQGAALLWDGRIFRAAPHPVHAIEPVGAGDCFDAGFLYAWLKGSSPEACLNVANLCGALSTEARGGIEGFPNIERLSGALD